MFSGILAKILQECHLYVPTSCTKGPIELTFTGVYDAHWRQTSSQLDAELASSSVTRWVLRLLDFLRRGAFTRSHYCYY